VRTCCHGDTVEDLGRRLCPHSAPADGFGLPGKDPVLPAARRGLAVHEESTLPTLLTQL